MLVLHCGVVEEGRPLLKFLSNSGSKEFRQNADRIGELLHDNEVPLVILNPCESARVIDQKRSNLAQILVEYGIPTVVAMQFPLTTTAAGLFIEAFYESYLVLEEIILWCVHYSRRILSLQRSCLCRRIRVRQTNRL
jgi:CHAT domain-containing protein